MTTRPEADEQLDRVRRTLLRTIESLPALPTRLTVRAGDVSFELEWPETPPTGGDASRAQAVVQAPDAPEIRSPSVGTFYGAPEPGAEPFVRVGELIHEGQQVAIVEAMKLMLPVEADRAGQVTAVLVSDGEPVQYGQALFTLEPLDV